MSILAGLHHVTRYKYDKPIGLGPQVVRLRPAPHGKTRIASYSLTVTPAQHFVNWQQDPHGNWLARFVFPEKATEFSVTVDLLADLEVVNPFDFFVEPFADKWPFEYPADLKEDPSAYVDPEPAGPLLLTLIDSISREPRNTVDFLVELNRRIQSIVKYIVRLEPGVQTPEETLVSGFGSCRPTNDMIASDEHIVLAVGRDYTDVAPMDGVIVAAGGQRIEVSVNVTPVN